METQMSTSTLMERARVHAGVCPDLLCGRGNWGDLSGLGTTLTHEEAQGRCSQSCGEGGIEDVASAYIELFDRGASALAL